MPTLEALIDRSDAYEEFRTLGRAWLRWRGDGLLPRHGDLRPEQLGPALAATSIYEILAPDQIVVRLNSHAADMLSADSMRGVNIIALAPPAQRGTRIRRYRAMADQPCGMYANQVFNVSNGETVRFAVLLLPVAANDGAGVRFVISAVRLLDRLDDGRRPGPPGIDVAADFQFVDIGAGVPAGDAL